MPKELFAYRCTFRKSPRGRALSWVLWAADARDARKMILGRMREEYPNAVLLSVILEQ